MQLAESQYLIEKIVHMAINQVKHNFFVCAYVKNLQILLNLDANNVVTFIIIIIRVFKLLRKKPLLKS